MANLRNRSKNIYPLVIHLKFYAEGGTQAINSVSNWKPVIENYCFLQRNVKFFVNLFIRSKRPSNKLKDQHKIHTKALHPPDKYNIFSF